MRNTESTASIAWGSFRSRALLFVVAALAVAAGPSLAQTPERTAPPQQTPPEQQDQPQDQQQPAAQDEQQPPEDDQPQFQGERVREPIELEGPRSRQQIADLLDRVDPEVLNRLIGANVTVEYVGGQIVLKGPEEAVRVLEALIRAIDEGVPRKVVRVVVVNERDAQEVARTVQEALRDVYQTPAQREEERVTITALSSTILLVSAIEEQIDEVVAIIEEVDAVPDPLGKVELMRFDVQYRKASDVAEELRRVLEQIQKAQGTTPERSKLQIIPNNANNTIVVTARESEREKIQALINQIDVEPKEGWGELTLTVFPLIHSEAAQLADVITELLQTRVEGGGAADDASEAFFRLQILKATLTGEVMELPPIDLQRAIRIIPEENTNALIVATYKANIEPMGELIRLLDGVPLGVDVGLRLFPLRFADAETIRETLQNMFDEGKELPADPDGSGDDAVPADEIGRALVYNIGLAADLRTNTLIVSGRIEQLRLVESVVRELDRPARSLKFPLRLIPLQYTDATRIGQLLEDLFEKRIEALEATNAGASAVERERVFLSIDIRTNSLIVSAAEENVEEIREITSQLDRRPGQVFAQIRLVPLQRLDAPAIKEKIDELWQRKAELRRTEEMPEDLPIIAVDERSNTLIIASSPEDYDEIVDLVSALEQRPLSEDLALYQLAYADAAMLKDMLDELFEGIAQGAEVLEAPTIIADTRSNALLVAGTRDMLERVAQTVERLDVQGGPRAATIRVYTLDQAAAARLAPRIQELFDARAQEQDRQGTPVVVFADEGSNTIVASASRDDHEVIDELVEVLDRPSSIARQVEIFPLKLAKAGAIAERLEALFQAQAEGAEGRADATAVEADERTNSLIVWAAPSAMDNIAQVIRRLDTAAPAVTMMVRVIQLKHALAEDFAELLRQTLVGEEGGEEGEQAVIINFQEEVNGRMVTRQLLRQDIKVEPDPRTNSLMVMAPADSMAMLEAMIRDFDRIRPIRSEVRLFPLINSDAESMVVRLEELFAEEGGGAEGDVRSQLVLGGEFADLDATNVGQELRFTADPRTNTLIAAGSEVDLRMIESLVYYLDAQAAESRVTSVYQTKFRGADDIASAVQAFIQQEQDVYGELDDEESQRRRVERQVSIESVGAEEEGGSSHLLIGTSRQTYQQTMEMIAELDRPEPQVRLSMLIAEITVTDDLELGMEIAGQDLRFTEGAVLGPNGTIQGGDFDYVLGTEVGAAGVGLGGLTFTLTGEDFSFLFHTLQQQTALEVLSRPTLLVRNGEEGNITIADQVPTVESSQLNDTGSTQSVIGREDVGIVLTAVPRISPDGYVTVALTQEISNLGESIQLTEGVTSPIFSTREVNTNVTVRDGETVVIGGLIQRRDTDSENKIPILGDLPWVGPLFRFTSVSHAKTELLIVMTAEIIRSDEDAYNMSSKELKYYTLPPQIAQNPLLESLRILPEDAGLGPVPAAGRPQFTRPTPAPGAARQPTETRPVPRVPAERYGPEPRTYGPKISKPTAPRTTSTTTASAVYGPRVPDSFDCITTPDAGPPLLGTR